MSVVGSVGSPHSIGPSEDHDACSNYHKGAHEVDLVTKDNCPIVGTEHPDGDWVNKHLPAKLMIPMITSTIPDPIASILEHLRLFTVSVPFIVTITI